MGESTASERPRAKSTPEADNKAAAARNMLLRNQGRMFPNTGFSKDDTVAVREEIRRQMQSYWDSLPKQPKGKNRVGFNLQQLGNVAKPPKRIGSRRCYKHPPYDYESNTLPEDVAKKEIVRSGMWEKGRHHYEPILLKYESPHGGKVAYRKPPTKSRVRQAKEKVLGFFRRKPKSKSNRRASSPEPVRPTKQKTKSQRRKSVGRIFSGRRRSR